MSIKHAISFDHIGNMLSSSADWGKMFANLPIVFRGLTGNYKLREIIDGWLTAQNSTSATFATMSFDIPSLVPEGTKVTWFGFRWKLISTGSADGATSVMWLAHPSYQTGTDFVKFIATSELSAMYPDYTTREFYFEAGVDWENHQLLRRVNGQWIEPISLTSQVARLENRTLTPFFNLGSSSRHQHGFKDIVIINNDEEGIQGPIGPQRLVELDPTVDPATTWVSSNGDLQSPLNTALTAGSIDAPTLTSPVEKETLKVSLKFPDGVPHNGVTAVYHLVSAGLAEGAVGELTSRINDGVRDGSLTTIVSSTTMTHNHQMGIDEVAPDGQSWTEDKVNQLSLLIDVE